MQRVLLLAAVCLFVMGFGAVQADDAPVPRFEPAPCPYVYARYEAECGYVVVPEEHARPDSPTIRVMIAIFRTASADPLPDPVIFLAGGPGNETLYYASLGLHGYLDRALEHRDIILLDQRGMGLSQPSLNCPEVEDNFKQAEAGPYAAFDAVTVAASARCYERLTDEGVNIAAFNTVESAADVADIAEALGYEQINIYAGSYGTTLAMTVMRHHPERLRSVMLTAITPPQIDLMASFAPALEHTLTMLFESCAADPTCAADYPQLDTMFYETVARLNDEPVRLTATNPLTYRPISFVVDGNFFVRVVQSASYNAFFLPQFPAFVAAAYAEQYETLEQFLTNYWKSAPIGTEGANYAMRCMDDVLTTTEATWNASIDGVNAALQPAFRDDVGVWQDICSRWGTRRLGPEENTPVVSDIPTLILNGAYDPVTPADWGALAQETLPNAYNYTFPDDAHGVNADDCSLHLYEQFLADPTQAPDASCLTG